MTLRLINVGRQMSRLTELADRIKSTKATLEREADNLHAQLDELDKTAPDAFAHGERFIANQKAEVAGITSVLTQLTNLPLSDGGLSKDELQERNPSPTSQYSRG